MGMLIIGHKVKDTINGAGVRPARQSARVGWLTNPCVFRSSDDKNEVVILFDTEDSKKAKDFVASRDLKDR